MAIDGPASRLGSTHGTRSFAWPVALAVALLSFVPMATARGADSSGANEPADLAAVAKDLANPVSNVWALFTEFDLGFSDGDINRGSSLAGGRMIFQPVMPFPLYGAGDEQWKMITRPTVPVIFSQALPRGFDQYDRRGGIGDIQLPMLVSPPAGKWLLGAGPAWLLPTSTHDAFGRQQWGVGPTAVFGYASRDFTAAIFPQYYFGIGDRADRNDDIPDGASYMNLLYSLVFNLSGPGAWQVGANPTVTYDHRAASGNRWNVPIGGFVAKTTRVGTAPVKFQLGIEYSVVRQDDFGQSAQIKFNVIPVIPSLVQKAVFGGS